MSFSGRVPGAGDGVDRVMWIPAPDVDGLGCCTTCGEPKESHVTADGSVSVREFHRAALGSGVRFLDDMEGDS